MRNVKQAIRKAIRENGTRDPDIIIPAMIEELENQGYEPYKLLEENKIKTQILLWLIETIELGGLREAREELGLTRTQFGTICHICPKTIRALEEGTRKPHKETIRKIKIGLEKARNTDDIEQLIEDERKKKYPPEHILKGAELRSRRLQLGRTMLEVADIAGVKLSRVERAEKGDATPETMELIDKVLTKLEKIEGQ